MYSKIDKFKEKLKRQVDRAESLTTLGDFYAVSYDFVEIIENDPILNKFIEKKINEHHYLKRKINSNKKEGIITQGEEDELYSLHINNNFWHNHYCLTKQRHDIVKVSKHEVLGIEEVDNIDVVGLYFSPSQKEKSKRRLTTKEKKDCKKAFLDFIDISLSNSEFKDGDFVCKKEIPKDISEKVDLLLKSDSSPDLVERLDDKTLNREIKRIKDCYNAIATLIDSNLDYFKTDTLSNDNNNLLSNYFYDKEDALFKIVIGSFKIEFTGRIARVADYFYSLKDIDNSFKKYNELNFKINNDQLRRDVSDINKRVAIVTNGVIKEIITMAPKKTSTSTNKYRWEIIT